MNALLLSGVLCCFLAAEDTQCKSGPQTPATSETQKSSGETQRETLRAKFDEAVKQGDQAAADRLCRELIALPAPTLRDCRLAIRHLEARKDWPALAAAYTVTANLMQTIIAAPPERFTRAAPPAVEIREPGPTIEVQTELDGVWQKCKGPAEGWLDWIRRKQGDMKLERFKVLCRLATVYRDRLHQPKQAAEVLRESLADVPFFTMPLEKLIAEQSPAKKRKTELALTLGIHVPAATDLVGVLESLEQFDAAIEMQDRVVLANYSWGGLPYRDIEKLWTLLKKRPPQSPLPRVAWIHLVSPEQRSVEFDLDGFYAPRTEHKLNQLCIAPRPDLELDSLELTVDMEGKGGYVGVFCSTLRDGKHARLGGVSWYDDRRTGRETRTAKFTVPKGTGVIYFNRAWLPETDPDGVVIHRLSVKATFRPGLAGGK